MTAATTTPLQQHEPLRVFVIDDHEHVLWGLRKLIEGEWPRMTLAGTATNLPDALAALRRRPADVVVLDLVLGEEDSIGHIAEIRAGGAQIVVLTGSQDAGLHRRALREGASTVVLKDDPANVLLREIERVRAASESRPPRVPRTADGQ